MVALGGLWGVVRVREQKNVSRQHRANKQQLSEEAGLTT